MFLTLKHITTNKIRQIELRAKIFIHIVLRGITTIYFYYFNLSFMKTNVLISGMF